MKNTALILSLATALLLSACNTPNSETDNNSLNDQVSENTEVQTNDKVDPPNSESIENKTEKTDKLVNNNDAHKKDTIKFLYRDTVLSYKNDFRADGLDTLFAYADKDLQNAIALVKGDAMNTYENGEVEVSTCSEIRYILNLNVGNGYSIDEAADVKYKTLSNGNVRASIMLQGDEDIEDSSFDSYKDFSLSCTDEGCKVTDMFDSEGKSAIQDADTYCR